MDDLGMLKEIDTLLKDGGTDPFKTLIYFDNEDLFVGDGTVLSVVEPDGYPVKNLSFQNFNDFENFLEKYLTYPFCRPFSDVEIYHSDSQEERLVSLTDVKDLIEVVLQRNRPKKLKKLKEKLGY